MSIIINESMSLTRSKYEALYKFLRDRNIGKNDIEVISERSNYIIIKYDDQEYMILVETRKSPSKYMKYTRVDSLEVAKLVLDSKDSCLYVGTKVGGIRNEPTGTIKYSMVRL